MGGRVHDRMRHPTAGWGAALACLVASPVAGQDVSIVLDRSERAVELFLGMPARTAVDAFGLSPDLLTEADGTVDFIGFRQGTWDIGDALFDGVEARIGTEIAAFEGMSVMVHLADQRLPMTTPLDALIAISVCGVEPPDTPPTIDDLYLYAGLIAETSDPRGIVRLDLPMAQDRGLDVQIRDYREGVLLASAERSLDRDVPLVIGGAEAAWRPRTAGIGLSLAVVLSVLAGLGWAMARRRV